MVNLEPFQVRTQRFRCSGSLAPGFRIGDLGCKIKGYCLGV